MRRISLIERSRAGWRGFSGGRVGHRFRDRYHRRRSSGERSRLSTALMLSGGLALMLAGVVMLITPGPGWISLFLGLGLVAGESLPTARLMDRAEIRGRKALRRAAKLWRGSPGTAWSVTGSLALTCAVALGYGGYLLAY
jgi:Flp pilus assembly protein TadB